MPFFTKKTSFVTLFPFQHIKSLLKRGSSLKGKNLLKSLPLRVDPFSKGMGQGKGIILTKVLLLKLLQ